MRRVSRLRLMSGYEAFSAPQTFGDIDYVEEDGGQHDWSYWQRRLPELLSGFRRGRAGCAP